jgi:hypothetical protein
VRTYCLYLIFYTRVLEKLFTFLNGQQKGALGKIKGLFKQPKAAERLETCKQELGRMVELFKVGQTNLIPMHVQSTWAFLAGSSNRFNLVSNGANEKRCKGTT